MKLKIIIYLKKNPFNLCTLIVRLNPVKNMFRIKMFFKRIDIKQIPRGNRKLNS